jgi:molybdopterin converting factor small subunit
MELRVLFFGATADVVGKREVALSYRDGLTAHEAYLDILERFPSLCGKKLLLALNQEYVSGEELLRHGDELAVFTPVSGG